MGTGRVHAHAIAALAGSGLVVLFWGLWAVVAFVLFDRETNGLLIIAVTLAILLPVVMMMHRRGLADWRTALYSVLFIVFLALMYMIPIRGDLPRDAQAHNQRISQQHEDRYRYAEAVFFALAERYTGPIREYIRKPHRVFFIKEVAYFWNAEGQYVPSHIQAQLYRRMLLASGRFDPGEVEMRTGGCVNSPHGYVVIHHPEREIYADLWAVDNFDDYRFGQRVEMPGCGRLEDAPQGKPFRP